ncbi:hypothetical protein ACQQ2Q_15025 [Agrobacterium sp. ES01]|uniref:hypothetical protein n=1 Tax=Agrobacterium sp. ES01 TaxID=3420714 RepID=UPI003D0B5AEA
MAKMTTYLLWAVSALILLIIGSIILTIWRAHAIEARYPNIGTLTDLGDMQMNALHIPAGPDADLPPIVFIHGASGNLRDQALAFRKPLGGGVPNSCLSTAPAMVTRSAAGRKTIIPTVRRLLSPN